MNITNNTVTIYSTSSSIYSSSLTSSYQLVINVILVCTVCERCVEMKIVVASRWTRYNGPWWEHWMIGPNKLERLHHVHQDFSKVSPTQLLHRIQQVTDSERVVWNLILCRLSREVGWFYFFIDNKVVDFSQTLRLHGYDQVIPTTNSEEPRSSFGYSKVSLPPWTFIQTHQIKVTTFLSYKALDLGFRIVGNTWVDNIFMQVIRRAVPSPNLNGIGIA